MKKFWTKTADARATSLKLMKAALILAVAIVAGVIVINLVGHQLAYVGLWLMGFAFQMALGLAIGTVAYAIISKVVHMALDASELTLDRVQVINPWRGLAA